jgi:hypothetical protein
MTEMDMDSDMTCVKDNLEEEKEDTTTNMALKFEGLESHQFKL